MNPWKFYLRWRHSRGYGVHSPFAYRFVTDVLRPGRYGLYAFLEIQRFTNQKEFKDSKFIKSTKGLIRLINFLNSRRVLSYPAASRITGVAAKAMKIDYENIVTPDFDFRNGDLLILRCGNTESTNSAKKFDPTGNTLRCDDHELRFLENCKEALKRGDLSIVALDPTDKQRVFLSEALNFGLLFNSPDKMIIIPRKEMAFVAYDIIL